jgi:hypothetical protein
VAKGQKRSNRELKKPKKTVPGKPKGGAQSAFSQPSGAANKPGWKKP